MQYTTKYTSPLGPMLLSADDTGITGAWFVGQAYYARGLAPNTISWETPVLQETKRWLDIYFSGREPSFLPPLHPAGTAFQQEIWQLLCTISYGKTVSYGELAVQYARQKGLRSMSAQAVGNAVGKNPISVLIPCHRVLGSHRQLTGYAGGIDKKAKLLQLEGCIL